MTFAVVLGGGGYAGSAFHAGVLTALARRGWDARSASVLLGTSAGAASAALVRVGFPPAEYVAAVLEEPLSREAAEAMAGIGPLKEPPRPSLPPLRPAAPRTAARGLRHPGSVPLGVIGAALTPPGTVDVDDVSPGYGPRFLQWPGEPLWITSVSITSGRRVAFGRDRAASVPEAVSASVAIPGYFTPVVIDGEQFVDGGAWSTHHADLLAGTGVDTVIVSAPSSTTEALAADPGNLIRAPIRRQLGRELAILRDRGIRTIAIEPDRAIRSVMGSNSMLLGRRPRIALAVQHYAEGVLRRSGM